MSRLIEGTTPDKVKTHLHSKGIEVKEVFVFPSKIKGTVAARVRVLIEHKPKALDANNWPPHVRVQSWIQKRKPTGKDAARSAGSNQVESAGNNAALNAGTRSQDGRN